MQRLIPFPALLLVFVLSTTYSYSQTLYLSAANGLWNSASTWSISTDGGLTWFPASTPPTGSENITVDDTVEVDVAVSISGNVIVSGIGNIEIAAGSMAFTNGSSYEHARNSGGIPPSTWLTGSTCKITGITNQAPANRNQSYYNLIWNCPNQAGNFNMGFNNVTIGGDITIQNTGASSRWYFCGPVLDSTVNVTVLGDLVQTGGQVSSNGTGNSNTTIIIHQYGDIIASNGNFSISRGSQGGTGTTSWYLHGSNFTLSNVTTQNSNPTGAKFIFAGTTQQNLTLSNVSYAGGGFPLEVAAGAIMNAGLSEISGNGIFTLIDNGTLQTGNVAGLDSTIKTTGVITLSNAANYTFNGTSAQVTGNRLPSTLNNFTVNNNAGVTPTNNVTVNGNLTISSGDLHLNGKTITLGPSATLIESAGNTVTDQTGMIVTTRNLNAPSGVNVGGMGAMITSSANLGNTTVQRQHFKGTGNVNEGIFRVFNIIPTNNTGLNATLRYYYDESELNGISETNLRLFKSASGSNNSWSFEGGTVNTANNYVELSSIGSFSYWTLANVNAPIPVELTSFTASANINGVLLEWSTASETNNSGWNIERKQIDERWQKIGFVEGNGTSTTTKNYSFTDNKLTSGKYQYRLQQVDYDGTLTYSEFVEVEFNFIPDDFALHQNYPNPFNPSTVIEFDIPSATFINLSVYNSIGEKIAILINEQMASGVHTVLFDAGNLPSGIYIYRLTADHHVFTNKMMLIK